MRKHFLAFGGFFAESVGLLQKARECFEVKSVDSFNAKNPRGIAAGVFFVPKNQKVAKKLQNFQNKIHCKGMNNL